MYNWRWIIHKWLETPLNLTINHENTNVIHIPVHWYQGVIEILLLVYTANTYNTCMQSWQVRKRLAAYYAHQEDLQDYYSAAARVNADQDPHTVFEYIESTIVNPLPKKYTAAPGGVSATSIEW